MRLKNVAIFHVKKYFMVLEFDLVLYQNETIKEKIYYFSGRSLV